MPDPIDDLQQDLVKVGGTTDVPTRVSILSPASLLPIGAALAVMVAGISSAVWLNTTLIGLGNKIDRLSERMDAVEILERRLTLLEKQGSENWRAWVPLLRASNPTLVVPPADGGR